MRVDSFEWRPVRLEARRISNRTYRILRDGKTVGDVTCRDGGWRGRKIRRRSYYPGYGTYLGKEDDLNLIASNYVERKSFIAAVLYVSRITVVHHDDYSIQDFGLVRMRRVCIETRWFTFLEDGKSEYVYEDKRISVDSDENQAILKKAIVEVNKCQE